MSLCGTLAANKPVAGAFRLARHGDVLTRLSLQIAGVVPIAGHVTDKLESIHVLGIVLGQVGSHLQRRIHGDVERQLTHQRTAHLMGIATPCVQMRLQNARSIVHRTSLQAGERQDTGMVGVVGVEGFVLSTACRLIAYHIWPGTANSRRTGRLMGIDHDVMLGSLLNHIEVVIVHGLRVVMVATGDDVAYVTRLHGIVAILVHQFKGILEVTFIVLCRG